jgi:heterogeneous nuclear rnp K-like protein 2
MSASPTAPAHSTKRPLEDPSSPSGPTDQPDAKRPALDKMIKADNNEQKAAVIPEAPLVVSSNGDVKTEAQSTNGTKTEVTDEQGDVLVPDAPGREGTHAIQTTGPSSRGQTSNLQHDESGWIHIRAVISSPEAATVIGKGGENVSTIRKLSGAKCTVSDYQKGAVERILTVSGLVDAVAKVLDQSKFIFLTKQINMATRLLVLSFEP